MTQSQSATGDQMGAPPPIQATHKPRLSNWTRFRFLRSTGFRFAILHTLIFVISVAIIGAITEVAVTSSLERQARQRVDTEAAALVNGFERDGSAALRSVVQARLATRQDHLRYAVLDSEGRIMIGDGTLASLAAPAGVPAQTVMRPTSLSSSDTILVATRSLGDGSRLVIADDLESIEDVEDVVSNAFLIALTLALALGLGVGFLMTNTLLKRVEAVTRTAEAIIAGDLSRRIDQTGSGDDFDRLSETLNAMLDRIGGLMENLRQVSNDIAHDLRTPLSRLRQGLEEASGRNLTSVDYESVVERAIGEADALLETFSALLRIAQIEAGARRSAFQPVDLSDAMHTVAEAYTPAIEEGGRSLRTEIATNVQVRGDRDLLVQLFANLIENANHHTPPGTSITLRLAREPDAAIAEIADDGPGIPEEERAKVLRRFYRLEHSRTTPGNGLGLSLAAAVVGLHHGVVELLDNAPGLRVVVRLSTHDS